MHSIIRAVLIGGVAAGGLSSAFAQEPYRDEPHYQYSTQQPYYLEPDDDDDDDDDDDEGAVTGSVICSESRYWNGERCVDAPVGPPTS